MINFRTMGVQHNVILLLLLHGVLGYILPCYWSTCPPRPGKSSDIKNNNGKGNADEYYIIPIMFYCFKTVSIDTELKLCACGLTAVSEYSFWCLSGITLLDMRKNKLEEIPRRTLHCLVSLQELILDGKSYNETLHCLILFGTEHA